MSPNASYLLLVAIVAPTAIRMGIYCSNWVCLSAVKDFPSLSPGLGPAMSTWLPASLVLRFVS
ncbi:MAG: hypothetical protein AAF716_23685, partial [Cyanobacteria bacterium P01_D01_bin.1]